MNDLIQQLTSKIGISADQARSAIETVVNFLKTKLPGAVGPQLDAALGQGGEGAAGVADKLKGMLGS
jgi:hypothetical protein